MKATYMYRCALVCAHARSRRVCLVRWYVKRFTHKVSIEEMCFVLCVCLCFGMSVCMYVCVCMCVCVCVCVERGGDDEDSLPPQSEAYHCVRREGETQILPFLFFRSFSLDHHHHHALVYIYVQLLVHVSCVS